MLVINIEEILLPRGSSNLVSDGSGVIEGSFLLPNNDSLRFKKGDREFKLLDISVDDQKHQS